MNKFISLVLIFLFISSCSNKKDTNLNIYGIWTLSESENLKEREIKSEDALLEESEKILEAKQNITLSIFPDNTYTKLCCKGDKYEFGTWKWLKEGERISFSPNTIKYVQ